MLLRACYAMSGTDLGYAGTRRLSAVVEAEELLRYPVRDVRYWIAYVIAYVIAYMIAYVRCWHSACPVLTSRMSGTGIAYAAMRYP
eukprot:493342-Rhodomonas_salina.1